jgi:hypothetical protein
VRSDEAPRPIDAPEPGCFEMRMVKHGPYVPAEITCTNGVWAASINGEACGTVHHDPVLAEKVMSIWQFARRISREEYSFMLARKNWAIAHNTKHPAANPTKAIDLRTFPPLF